MTWTRTLADYLSLVKFSHTIFALPFALLGFFLAVLDEGELSWRKFALVVACMVFARSAAMAFNRWLDRDIDEKNPRTAVREIPSGIITSKSALLFVVLNSLLFMAAAGLLNPLCLMLSPVALLVILGYSYTKRFTYLCHFVLGLGLALAPIGAYLAVTAQWSLLPVLYGIVVLLWVSGFDIIYSLQDEEFDREQDLFSIPVRMGKRSALLLGRMIHVVCGGVLMMILGFQAVLYPEFSWLCLLAGGIFIAALIYQHTLVTPQDLSRVNLAFFTTNGLASLIFGVLSILDIYV
ncbi:UbiA-like polyprenyltransferase [Lewinella sp. W8]|uniref:UbiA-like polyprenyltransferase n=1 Tax=Lewinella sp. W8 TaxID=2528208 RepID=UPI001067E9FB|nr:UbiA-like polyprenyltransferase [Lewinella sp. W8]MTB51368.1 4-hydroxybenzoate octaprenyltransferase [Lewinella sp. W8]